MRRKSRTSRFETLSREAMKDSSLERRSRRFERLFSFWSRLISSIDGNRPKSLTLADSVCASAALSGIFGASFCTSLVDSSFGTSGGLSGTPAGFGFGTSTGLGTEGASGGVSGTWGAGGAPGAGAGSGFGGCGVGSCISNIFTSVSKFSA